MDDDRAKGTQRPGLTYRDAGVDIDAQEDGLRRIRAALTATRTPGVPADLGAFGMLFAPDLAGLASPVLVASCDGVGTKLRVAFATGVHDTVGRDLVNHCVNDILVQGARPLFFLDYVAMGVLDPAVLAAVVEGIARGCREAGCALLGGETAEMPGFYAPGEYDVAGFIVGIVDRAKILGGGRIRIGDLLIGLPSAGLHTNGYSLAREILFEREGLAPDTHVSDWGGTVAQALLAEHRSYLPTLRETLDADLVEGLAHITGGGLTDNLPRILPAGTAAAIDRKSWTVPALFRHLERAGGVPLDDMYRTFNMGIGMVAAVRPDHAEAFEAILARRGEPHWRIGSIVAGEGRVVDVERGRAGILLSGRGSNMVALVEAMREGRIDAEPAIVLSNLPEAAGLSRASQLGVPIVTVDHRAVRPREAHERRVVEVLRDHGVDLVCLAGYMRLLSPWIVEQFRHRILNIHPSLLPAFPGLDAQRQAIEHGAKVSGCTVHFVDEQCDHGPIVLQAAVPVLDDDDVPRLSARILEQEHRIYSQAVAWFFEGRLRIEERRVRVLPKSHATPPV